MTFRKNTLSMSRWLCIFWGVLVLGCSQNHVNSEADDATGNASQNMVTLKAKECFCARVPPAPRRSDACRGDACAIDLINETLFIETGAESGSKTIEQGRVSIAVIAASFEKRPALNTICFEKLRGAQTASISGSLIWDPDSQNEFRYTFVDVPVLEVTEFNPCASID